jgi:hypothetical protein
MAITFLLPACAVFYSAVALGKDRELIADLSLISFIDFFVNVKLLQPRWIHLDRRFGPRLLSGFGGRRGDYGARHSRSPP